MEHGGIGHAYGRAGYGTDIRLACHGLDKNDNDFVVGAARARTLPALVDRAAHAQDQADVAAPGAARPVLCRQGDLARSRRSSRMKTAILLLAYGGPDSLDDIPGLPARHPRRARDAAGI